MIFIYNRDEIQVDVLDIEPKFTEEISKLNTLEFETYAKLEKGYRVVYKQDGKPYEFIIIDSDYVRNDDVLFTYFCQDSLTELNASPILDKRPQGSYKQALTSAFENTRWQLVFSADFSEAYTQNNSFYHISVLEAFSKVAEDYNIEWHTEYTSSGSKITGRKLVISKLGTQSNSRLEFGKNIKQFSRKISSEPIFTALYGYGKGEETESGGYGRRISFADINGGLAYVTNEDARLKYGIGSTGSKEHLFGFFIDEEETDKTKLLESTKKELERVSQPQAEYTVEAVNLHIDCGIGDTVPVIDDELGFRGNTRIIKVVTQGDNKELTFGQVQKAFTDSFTKEIQKSAEATEIKITSIMETRLNQIAEVYFGEDGYNYDLKVGNEYGLPAGLYSFDAPIDQDPTKVIYFGAGKLLIADSKATDGGWAWKTALDGQGIVGSSIVAHSITANQLAADVGQSLDLSSNVSITQTVKSETQSYIDANKDQLKGADGNTPYVEGGYWYINGVSTGIKARGQDGAKGTDGVNFTWNMIKESKINVVSSNNSATFPITSETLIENGNPFVRIKRINTTSQPTRMSLFSNFYFNRIDKMYANKRYTFSFEARASHEATATYWAEYRDRVAGDNTTIILKLSTTIVNKNMGLTTAWDTFSITFTMPNDTNEKDIINLAPIVTIPEGEIDNFHLDLRNWKLEEGANIKPIWSPHESDIQGQDGAPGKDGMGIVSTTIAYAVNQSGTTKPTSGWSGTVPKTNPGDYIWTKTTWKYTDDTSEDAYSVGRIGVDGPNGEDGLPGAPGVGIKMTTITYTKSTSGTVIPPSTATWSPSPPAGNPGEFIWTKTVWTYTDNTTETGYSVGKIGNTGPQGPQGIQGANGKDGAPGKGIKETKYRYAKTSAPSPEPTESQWSAIKPEYAKGDYAWTQVIWVYTDGTVENSAPMMSYIAEDGVGISDTLVAYALSTTNVQPSDNLFSPEVPDSKPGDYVWTRVTLDYTDPSKTDTKFYTSARVGKDGATPYIGTNGNWWINGVDTGIKAEGTDGTNGTDGADGATPYVGTNGNWWIDGIDTGVQADVGALRTEFESYRTQTDKDIADRVTKTEYSGLTTRVAQAEQKLTPTSITQTVESNTTTLAAKADVQTTAENWTATFSQIGGRNLLVAKDSGSSIIRDASLENFKGRFWAEHIYSKSWVSENFEPNKTYTIRFKAKMLDKPSTNQNSTWASITFSFYEANAGMLKMGSVSLGDYTNMGNGDEIEVVNTFTTPNNVKDMAILLYCGQHDPSSISEVEFSDVKLEKGSVATDWTPSPEDVQAEMDALAGDIEGVQADVAPIREEFESLRTQTASQISEMITKTVFDSNNAEVSGKILAVEKEVDNLEIKFSNSGGINLIKDGKYPTNWSPYDGSTITEYPNQSVPNWDTTKAVNVIASSGNKTGQIKAYKNLMPIGFDVAGSIYTVSIYVKNMRDDAVLWVSVNGLDAPNQWVGRREEKRLIFTGAYDGTRTLQVLLRGETEAYAVNCLVYQLMVERGAVAHDWSQHPDELVAGATKINEEGVHVYGADGDGGVHTVTKPEGFFIYDGEGRPIQEVNAEESKISKANILDLYTPTAPRRIYETYDVYTDSSSYGDGSGDSWENRSDNITQAIRNVSGGAGAEFLSRYAIINVNVYGVTNEIVRIAGLVGDGELNLLGREGQLISGAIKVMHCTIPINLKAINIRYETNTESDACILANNNRQLIIQGGNLYGKGTAKGIRAVNSNVRANNVGMFDLSDLAVSTTMSNVTLNACRGSNNVNGGSASLGGILSYIQGYPSLSETGNFTASSSGLVLGLKVETGGGSTTTKPVIAERKLTTVSKTFTAQLSTRTSGDTRPWLYDALRQGRWSGNPKPYVGILRFGTNIYDWLKEGGGYSGTPTATITAYRSKGIGSGSVALKISNDVVITTGGVALGGQATSSLSSTAVARIISSSPVTLWTTTSALSDYAEFYKVTIRVTAQKYL